MSIYLNVKLLEQFYAFLLLAVSLIGLCEHLTLLISCTQDCLEAMFEVVMADILYVIYVKVINWFV